LVLALFLTAFSEFIHDPRRSRSSQGGNS
jgi:hypothetical protein